MTNPWRQVLQEVADRMDAELLKALYERASLRTADIRRELDEAGLPRADADLAVPLEELDRSARTLIDRAERAAFLRGAVGGLGGALTIPPEILAALVQALRLAQRLAVVYGHDPETDAGRLLLARAMSAALGIELPMEGQLTTRVSDIPALIRRQLPTARRAGPWLARIAAVRLATSVGRRLGRALPGLGAALGGVQARRALHDQAEAIHAVLRRAWTGDLPHLRDVQDAVEVS